MESISVFDMLSIGVGPSSSHTLGPWRAGLRWIEELKARGVFDRVVGITVDLYGSLSLTGIGHATDVAVMMGLCGYDPETFPTDKIDEEVAQIKMTQLIDFNQERPCTFRLQNISFSIRILDFHPNGDAFTAELSDGSKIKDSYYSIGGGFIVKEERKMERLKWRNSHISFSHSKWF